MNFEQPPKAESEESAPTPETSKVENIDSYEMQKIKNALANAEHLVAVIQNYIKMAEFCDEKGIKAKGRTSLEKIGYEGGANGPDSDLLKLARMFESGQHELAGNINVSDKEELEKRFVK